MRKLLNEISVIPGVTGSCIFDKNDGPLCQDIHANLSTKLLETVGIHLVRLIQMGVMSELIVQSAHFRFDKYTVVGMPLDSGAVLLTVCDAQANCSLVATTAAMLVSDMREELARGVTEPPPVSKEEVEELDAFEVNEVEEQAGDAENSMQPMFDRIEEALAGAIGPVAGMVMQDYIDKWEADGPAVPARLSELASMLVEEIGDPNLAQEFIGKVENLM